MSNTNLGNTHILPWEDRPGIVRRYCLGVTLAGKPCRMTPLRGKEHCLNHDLEARVYQGKALATRMRRREGSGESLKARLARETEEAQVELVGVLRAALRSPSEATRLKAAEMLLDRHLGRPRVASELTVRAAPVYGTQEQAEEVARKLLDRSWPEGD